MRNSVQSSALIKQQWMLQQVCKEPRFIQSNETTSKNSFKMYILCCAITNLTLKLRICTKEHSDENNNNSEKYQLTKLEFIGGVPVTPIKSLSQKLPYSHQLKLESYHAEPSDMQLTQHISNISRLAGQQDGKFHFYCRHNNN